MSRVNSALAQRYGFKILDDHELLECIKELNIPLSLAQLKNPTTVDMRRTMLGIIAIMLDKPLETMEKNNTLVDCPPDLFSHPIDTYEQGAVEMDIFRHAQLMMEAAGVHDFSLNDMLNPTGRRFLIMLSGIVNFARFREIELKKYKDMVAHVDQLEQQKSHLADEFNSNIEQLKQYHELQQKEEPVIQSLESDTRELAKRIQQMHSVQMELVNQRKHLKQTHVDNLRKIESDKQTLNQIQGECLHLRDQIVHNPEQLKQRIEELRTEIIAAKADIQMTQVKAQDCRTQLDSIKSVTEGTEKAIKSLMEYEREKQRLQELKSLVKQKRIEIGEKQDECADLQSKEKHLNRQIITMNEKQERMAREHEMKKQHCNQMLSDAKRAKAAIEENNANVMKQIQANERIAAEMRARMEQERKKHLQYLLNIQAQYAQLENTVMVYNRKVFEAAGVSLPH